MASNYCIVYTPLIFDLMALVEKKDLSFSDLFLYISTQDIAQLNQNNYLNYLEFDKSKERLGLMEYSGMEFYALYYIANQIAAVDPGMRVHISDGKRKTVGDIIKQEKSRPFAVFISTLSANFPASVVSSIILNQAKIPVILGGIHISARPGDADIFIKKQLSYPDLFAIVRGPGDSHVIRSVINDIKNNRLKSEYLGRITIENGVWGRQNIIAPPRPKVPFLKKFPLIGSYLEKNIRAVMATPYLGCPYSCNFCSISTLPKNQRTFISRDPDDFINEILAHQKNGVNLSNRYFMFLPDNLLLGGSYLEKLLDKLIAAKLKINYATQISIDVAKQKNLLKKLRLSGATHFLIGFESLIIDNLEFIGKSVANEIKKRNMSVAEYYTEQIQTIKKYGISIIGAFIFGLPFDYFHSFDDHSGKDIIRFCHQNKIGIQAACLNDLPGSINFQESQKHHTYLYGKKETFQYLAGLTTADLTECNREMPSSLQKSPLAAFYMAYDTISKTNSGIRAIINSFSLTGRTLMSPTIKAKFSLKEKGYDLLGLFAYILATLGYGEHFKSTAYSRNSVEGIFIRLYKREKNLKIKKMFKKYVQNFLHHS
ncbi:MAG: hypothetical protein KJ737_14040 [Proteobacteria bacterium]|nr:hypothetical protein [Pseudomonadota bacterium]